MLTENKVKQEELLQITPKELVLLNAGFSTHKTTVFEGMKGFSFANRQRSKFTCRSGTRGSLLINKHTNERGEFLKCLLLNVS